MRTTLLLLLSLHGDGVSAFGSLSSSFTRSLALTVPTIDRKMGNMVMYEKNHDPPSSGASKHNMWSVLANTEKWISTILGNGENPYTRKEVSYICELSDDDALVVASLWRRLREGREQCESHGQTAEFHLKDNPHSNPPTFRQTQVIVVPNNANLNDWNTFDSLVAKINTCRRNARDFILDANFEQLELSNQEIGERDWSISVNCAHLHPNFGELTKEEELQQLKEEEEEVDVNLEAYKKQRLLARRAPYPSVCIETRATPPTDFRQAGPPPSVRRQTPEGEPEAKVTLDDVHKLEALFGKPAVFTKEPTQTDDAFWDAIGNAKGIQEIAVVSPLRQAQTWISENHHAFRIETSSFTTSECQYVDEAYEFVFNNIAMQQFRNDATQYLVYTNFVSSSATSLEKFATECSGLVDLMPSLKGKLAISILHPEHIEASQRAPVPVIVMTWK